MMQRARHLFMKTAARFLTAVACGALLIMTLLTFFDVIGRYGFNSSIFGASEMIELLMVGVVFAGFAFVTAADEHISVTLVDHLLIARAPVLMRWTRHIFGLVIYALLVFELWRMSVEAMENSRHTIVLGLPIWLFSCIAAVLSTLGLAMYALITFVDKEDRDV